MKIVIFALLALFFSFDLFAQDHWVKLGQMDVSQGYKTLYRLKLETPKGVHNADDIKRGMQVMRFHLTWLPPEVDAQEVKDHFKALITAEFDDPEDLKFNQIIIDKLIKKLPETKRHDVWFFEYSPDAGTAVFVQNKKVHNIIGAETNAALHKAWLLSSPVATAKLMKRLLKAQ